MFKYIVKGFEEMMDSIEKGFNETMNASYPEVERNELELITEYYIDPWLTDKIYLRIGFKEYFDAHAKKKDSHGYFPTVTVRQLMWALRMKPLKKERWETSFDHVPI